LGEFFVDYIPDAVVINLGTNDAFRIRVSGNDHRRSSAFSGAICAFLEQVRALNGDKTVACLHAGFEGLFSSTTNIEKAAQEYRAKTGDTRVVCFKFGAIDPWGEGMGGLGHPNAKTQQRMRRACKADGALI
jgi:lysophospholipase L1-like esterase